jgi:hypothetical protein
VDLGDNRIRREEDVASLSTLGSLRMVNLAGNTVMGKGKATGFLMRDVVVDHTEMYVRVV